MENTQQFLACPKCGNITFKEDTKELARQSSVRFRSDGTRDYDLAESVELMGETAEVVGYSCCACMVDLSIEDLICPDGKVWVAAPEPGPGSSKFVAEDGNTIWIGNSVIVTPKKTDNFSEFVGTFKNIRDEEDGLLVVTVVDQDDNAFDVFSDQVRLEVTADPEVPPSKHISANELICPNCRQNTLKANGSVWFEKGEFDGKEYEEEGYSDEYVCETCEFRFAVI